MSKKEPPAMTAMDRTELRASVRNAIGASLLVHPGRDLEQAVDEVMNVIGKFYTNVSALRETDSRPKRRPHCDTCGADVHEILCPVCAKWWNDNPPPTDLPTQSKGIVERLESEYFDRPGKNPRPKMFGELMQERHEAAGHIRTLEALVRELKHSRAALIEAFRADPPKTNLYSMIAEIERKALGDVQ